MMKRFCALILGAGVLALLPGCGLLQDRRALCEQGPPVVPLAWWPVQEHGVESLRFSRDARESQLVFAWKHAPELFSLRGLSPLGLEVFRLDMDAQGLRWNRAADGDLALDASRIVADFQLVHWPLAPLQRGYAQTPWELEEKGLERRLSCFGVLVATVEYAQTAPLGFLLSNIPGEYRLQGQALGGQ